MLVLFETSPVPLPISENTLRYNPRTIMGFCIALPVSHEVPDYWGIRLTTRRPVDRLRPDRRCHKETTVRSPFRSLRLALIDVLKDDPNRLRSSKRIWLQRTRLRGGVEGFSRTPSVDHGKSAVRDESFGGSFRRQLIFKSPRRGWIGWITPSATPILK